MFFGNDSKVVESSEMRLFEGGESWLCQWLTSR
jgi:hypothetical protein